jgi:COP9 signalosome complex subunit 4
MMGEGRLRGSIDQVDGLIHFSDALEQLAQWDRQVEAACIKVDTILDMMPHPAAAAAAAGGGGAAGGS